LQPFLFQESIDIIIGFLEQKSKDLQQTFQTLFTQYLMSGKFWEKVYDKLNDISMSVLIHFGTCQHLMQKFQNQ
jgi:hypothetical protein